MRDLLQRSPDLRRLWLAQVASELGNGVALVALPLYMVAADYSGTEIGVVLGASSLALVVFLLLGGVAGDRFPRHLVLVTSDLVRLVLHALLGILILLGEVPLVALLAIEVPFYAAEAFFRPTLTGLTPQTVEREEDVQAATALMRLPASAAQLVGGAIATALVLAVGPGAAFLIDAVTFGASAALVLRMSPRRRGEEVERAPAWVELREGWGEFRSRAWVWVTVAVFSIGLVVTHAPYIVLGPLAAESLYGREEAFGYIAVAAGAGALAGTLIGMHSRPERPMRAGMLATFASPVFLMSFALGAPLPVVMALGLAAEGGFSYFMVQWETALAQRIPAHALSRVSAYDWMGSAALLPVGLPLIGILGEELGRREVIGACAILSVGIFAVGLAPRETRAMRRLRGPVAPADVPGTLAPSPR